MCLTHTEGKFTLTVKSGVCEREEMRVDPVVRPTLEALCLAPPPQKCTPGPLLFPGSSGDPNQFIEIHFRAAPEQPPHPYCTESFRKDAAWKSLRTVLCCRLCSVQTSEAEVKGEEQF